MGNVATKAGFDRLAEVASYAPQHHQQQQQKTTNDSSPYSSQKKFCACATASETPATPPKLGASLALT